MYEQQWWMVIAEVKVMDGGYSVVRQITMVEFQYLAIMVTTLFLCYHLPLPPSLSSLIRTFKLCHHHHHWDSLPCSVIHPPFFCYTGYNEEGRGFKGKVVCSRWVKRIIILSCKGQNPHPKQVQHTPHHWHIYVVFQPVIWGCPRIYT